MNIHYSFDLCFHHLDIDGEILKFHCLLLKRAHCVVQIALQNVSNAFNSDECISNCNSDEFISNWKMSFHCWIYIIFSTYVYVKLIYIFQLNCDWINVPPQSKVQSTLSSRVLEDRFGWGRVGCVCVLLVTSHTHTHARTRDDTP